MKLLLQSYNKQLLVLSAALLLFTGCAARTRLGTLIPAHVNSHHTDGDVFIHIQADKEEGFIPFAAPLVTGAASLAIDYLIEEAQNEAKQYEAQFSSKVWLTTGNLGRNNNVLITRWVKNDGYEYVKSTNYTYATNLVSKIITNASVYSPGATTNFPPEEKRVLAFAALFVLKSGGNNSAPYIITPKWRWNWLSSAKVVSFKTDKPWSFPTGLLLKTGNVIEQEIVWTVEALTSTDDKNLPGMHNVGPKNAVLPKTKIDLSATNKYKELGEKPVGWFAIPRYPSTNSHGYFTIEITVNENDPSNVKKKLLKGADYLERHRESLLQKAGGGAN